MNIITIIKSLLLDLVPIKLGYLGLGVWKESYSIFNHMFLVNFNFTLYKVPGLLTFLIWLHSQMYIY